LYTPNLILKLSVFVGVFPFRRLTNYKLLTRLKRRVPLVEQQLDSRTGIFYIHIFLTMHIYLHGGENALVHYFTLSMEQQLLTLPEHLSSSPVLSGVLVTRSLVWYVCFVDRCLFFFLWPFCPSQFWLPLCVLFSYLSTKIIYYLFSRLTVTCCSKLDTLFKKNKDYLYQELNRVNRYIFGLFSTILKLIDNWQFL
jgi:hypothetical protein